MLVTKSCVPLSTKTQMLLAVVIMITENTEMDTFSITFDYGILPVFEYCIIL